jgi:hypothetical protein
MFREMISQLVDAQKAMRYGLLLIGLGWAHAGFAWMAPWAPQLKAAPVKIQTFSEETMAAFLSLLDTDFASYEPHAEYCAGGRIDLNGDEIDDYVFILPWMGCGLASQGYTAHFIVSGGANGRMETVVEVYDIALSDLVQVNGKIYFRHSNFFQYFEKSEHNHWVYQMFTFDREGKMQCANADFGTSFPAATIYYHNPKFKRVPLTANDLKEIATRSSFVSRKYIPAQRKLEKID